MGERTEQLNLRLEHALIREIERAAAEEALDRGTMVRRLLHDGLTGWRRDHAIAGYQAGRVSLGKAAEDAGLTQWELMDELRARQVSHPLRTEDVQAWFPAEAGFRATTQWMGDAITTLADVPPAPGAILLVGISPSPVSVEAGHYYQGKLGQRLWRRLQRAGVVVNPVPGREDEAFHRAGHGLTDVVKRPLGKGERPQRDELDTGASLLRQKVRQWRPGLIVFAFKQAAEATIGSSIRPGPGPKYEDCPTFLLPSPYAERSEVDTLYEDLARTWETRLHVFNASPTATEQGGRQSTDK